MWRVFCSVLVATLLFPRCFSHFNFPGPPYFREKKKKNNSDMVSDKERQNLSLQLLQNSFHGVYAIVRHLPLPRFLPLLDLSLSTPSFASIEIHERTSNKRFSSPNSLLFFQEFFAIPSKSPGKPSHCNPLQGSFWFSKFSDWFRVLI